ncbi:MAG: hypothetical protein KME55_41660 [Nostoc indistinguendum CM1-VF10]|nr:hypothetical protein [Nostoc indistinguendum CM1-VF10]
MLYYSGFELDVVKQIFPSIFSDTRQHFFLWLLPATPSSPILTSIYTTQEGSD